MKPKSLTAEANTKPALPSPDAPRLPERAAASQGLNRRAARQQMEELKAQVLELAERQMEMSLRILKDWIAEKKR